MEYLDNLVSRTIGEILKPEAFVFRLIEKRLEEKGIQLTEEQKINVKDQLSRSNSNSFHLELTSKQEKNLAHSDDGQLILNLLSDKELDELEYSIQQAITEATQETLTSVSKSLLDEWKSQATTLLKQQGEDRIEHVKLIDKTWAKPLNLLEILLSVSLEVGATFNEYYRPDALKDNDFVFEALTRLHARGCQVGAEALLLLRNGFADGAHARWRTLHEISVEACFISDQGNNVAEQFLCHSIVSDYRSAAEYQKHYKAIGYAPPEQKAIDAVKIEHDKVISRFGDYFRYDYGWAAQFLNMKRPTFADLEKFVGLDHLRPFYKLANMNVHSGSKGASFRLGLPPNDENLLVAGPSIFGLGEPGQNIAYSFHILTTSLLLTRENLDQIAFISATRQLMNEIVWAFDEVMESQEKEGS